MKASGGNINENATILWDFDIYTDRKIQANRSDIVVKSHDDKPVFSLIYLYLVTPMYLHAKQSNN